MRKWKSYRFSKIKYKTPSNANQKASLRNELTTDRFLNSQNNDEDDFDWKLSTLPIHLTNLSYIQNS